MDFFLWMLAATAAAGLALIIVSVFIRGEDDDADDVAQQSVLLDYLNLNTKIRDIDTSINEADSVITELNDVSKSVFKEIDDKYQELLFLYNLIEDKKKLLASAAPDAPGYVAVQEHTKGSASNPFGLSGKRSKVDIQVSDTMPKNYKNPKLVDILRLKREGLEVAEIAKTLGIGQGEVALILSLDSKANSGKGRDW